MKERFLTKSRFKLACECPTKLAYSGKPEYANANDEDSFLKGLADGGFQVGELAKLYHPAGVEVSTLDREQAVRETDELLRRDEVTIFEAALVVDKYYVRVDILRKVKNEISLIEVKAKSYHPDDHIVRKDGSGLMSDWEPYVYDVAFQTFVARAKLAGHTVRPFLCLADKSVHATVDGLNQKFMLSRDARGRTKIVVKGDRSPAALGARLLIDVPVENEVNLALQQPLYGRPFEQAIAYWAGEFAADRRIATLRSKECKTCEFKNGESKGLKDGFRECWEDVLTRRPGVPLSLSLWHGKIDQYLAQTPPKFYLTDLEEADVQPKCKPTKKKIEEHEGKGGGLERPQRQWIQIKKMKDGDRTPFVNRDLLKRALDLEFPLHFIDFETATVAIPFHKGRRAYETLAFQFSHHIMEANGKVRHHNDFLCAEPGKFPNFEFARALRASLGDSGGTIFRYSFHENSVLNAIADQLMTSEEPPPDRDELCAWIRSITKERGKDGSVGERSMVDLLDFVVRHYYHPSMGGSNSLKVVLPTVLNASKILRELHGRPDYGTASGIPSRNFKGHTWAVMKDGVVQDPYKQLEPLIKEVSEEDFDVMFPGRQIADGGAATMAYARLQFTEMHPAERKALETSLLKYCELDTLAMVMLYQYWDDLLK